MPKFKFSIFDFRPSDPLIAIHDKCNLHHFEVSFEIDELESDQEHAEILEKIYNIDPKILENEDIENSFSICKDKYPTKEDVIKYLESKGGEEIK